MMNGQTIASFIWTGYSRGKRPERNEDRILLKKRRGLAAIFDGVGTAMGDVGSTLAAETIQQHWRQQPTLSALPSLPENIEQLIQHAHQRIHEERNRRQQQNADGNPVRIGTTLVLTLLCPQRTEQGYPLIYAHIGDSRLYRYREGIPLERLTLDDSYINHMVTQGALSAEAAHRIDQATSREQLSTEEMTYFEQRNRITQALGTDKPLTIHLEQTFLSPGDRLLLCTDGVHDNLTDQEITQVLSQTAYTKLARKLVQAAYQRSLEKEPLRAKADDISAIVITCRC